MAKIIGRTGAVGIGIESTQGTKVAAGYWIPVQSYSYDDKVTKISNDSAMGRIEEINRTDITQLYGSGDFEGKIFLDSVGAELVALFGQSPVSTQRATSGVYDHAFTLKNDNDHKSLTIAYEDDLEETSFPFAMLDSWTLDVTLDDYVKRTASFMSKKGETATHTPAFTNEVEFIPSHASFKTASTQAGLDAASAVNVTGFKLEVKKNVELLYVLGSTDPQDIINKQFTVSGTIDLYFEDTTMRDYVFGNTNRAIRINLVDTTVDLGSGHDPQLYFDLHEVNFKEFERGWDANDPLRQSITFDAHFNLADSALLTARLTNTETSY